MSMAAAKRRITVGTRLLCVEHTIRPELVGGTRLVLKAQGNSFCWKDADGGESTTGWTYWPKAARFAWVDADTFRIGVGPSEKEKGTVTLRVLPEVSS